MNLTINFTQALDFQKVNREDAKKDKNLKNCFNPGIQYINSSGDSWFFSFIGVKALNNLLRLSASDGI